VEGRGGLARKMGGWRTYEGVAPKTKSVVSATPLTYDRSLKNGDTLLLGLLRPHPLNVSGRLDVCVLAYLLEGRPAATDHVAAMLLAVCLVVFTHVLGLGLDWSSQIHLVFSLRLVVPV